MPLLACALRPARLRQRDVGLVVDRTPLRGAVAVLGLQLLLGFGSCGFCLLARNVSKIGVLVVFLEDAVSGLEVKESEGDGPCAAQTPCCAA